VPVLNENDTRRDDKKSALATMTGWRRAPARRRARQGVILLSDVDGLYTANPASDPAMPNSSPKSTALDPGDRGDGRWRQRLGLGSGGMAAKLAAARIANSAGVQPGDHADGRASTAPLAGALPPAGAARCLSPGTAPAAKRPGSPGLTLKGKLHIDAGAVNSARHRQKPPRRRRHPRRRPLRTRRPGGNPGAQWRRRGARAGGL
jgi:glutamate 5-kinase